jgi:hypothetical protein
MQKVTMPPGWLVGWLVGLVGWAWLADGGGLFGLAKRWSGGGEAA